MHKYTYKMCQRLSSSLSSSRRLTRSSAVWSSPTQRPTRGRKSWRSWLQPMTVTSRSAATCAKAPRYSLSTVLYRSNAYVVRKLPTSICFVFFCAPRWFASTVIYFCPPFCFSLLSSTTTWQKSCLSSRTNAATSFLLARQSGMNYLSMSGY